LRQFRQRRGFQPPAITPIRHAIFSADFAITPAEYFRHEITDYAIFANIEDAPTGFRHQTADYAITYASR
jgi:hypothetical protein